MFMNILIIRVSAIGDIIHTLPALFYLKKMLPQAHISWVAQEKGASLLHSQPFLEKAYILPNHFLRLKNLRATKAVIKELRQTKWDAIIDFQGLLKTSLLYYWLSGKKFGFGKKHTRESLTTLFTHHQTTPEYQNIIQKNLALASNVVASLAPRIKAGPTLPSIKNTFDLFIPEQSKAKVNAILEGLQNKPSREAVPSWEAVPLVTLAPNTTWPSKHWPLEHWKKFLVLLCQTKFHVALLGKDFGEQGKALAEFVKEQKLPVTLVPPIDLLSVAYLLTKSNLLIAPDTGILHLADFLGTNAIGLFGPTLASKHGPFLTEANIKNAIQIPCPHRYKKEHGEQDCMARLLPEELYKTVSGVLKS